ncbi:MAG: hypothetical protein QG625_404 [Cyanobacteriota bacterium erpe_2018_sw_39hr_WHONDRS-SW48-000098_B_bin.30]|jgi:hypothetical protein|nr:hypothetical protein [Cyanobacteriota bacterium erpe_2018_sw_39hr_WHONDRS-SW48-000098_B_bin.30]
MNLNEVNKDKDQANITAHLNTVAAKFNGEPCKVWLSGVSRSDAEKVATKLRAGTPGWTFSVEDHGTSSYIVIDRSRLANSGDIGDH